MAESFCAAPVGSVSSAGDAKKRRCGYQRQEGTAAGATKYLPSPARLLLVPWNPHSSLCHHSVKAQTCPWPEHGRLWGAFLCLNLISRKSGVSYNSEMQREERGGHTLLWGHGGEQAPTSLAGMGRWRDGGLEGLERSSRTLVIPRVCDDTTQEEGMDGASSCRAPWCRDVGSVG